MALSERDKAFFKIKALSLKEGDILDVMVSDHIYDAELVSIQRALSDLDVPKGKFFIHSDNLVINKTDKQKLFKELDMQEIAVEKVQTEDNTSIS